MKAFPSLLSCFSTKNTFRSILLFIPCPSISSPTQMNSSKVKKNMSICSKKRGIPCLVNFLLRLLDFPSLLISCCSLLTRYLLRHHLFSYSHETQLISLSLSSLPPPVSAHLIHFPYLFLSNIDCFTSSMRDE